MTLCFVGGPTRALSAPRHHNRIRSQASFRSSHPMSVFPWSSGIALSPARSNSAALSSFKPRAHDACARHFSPAVFRTRPAEVT